jgi:hypothetical protein
MAQQQQTTTDQVNKELSGFTGPAKGTEMSLDMANDLAKRLGGSVLQENWDSGPGGYKAPAGGQYYISFSNGAVLSAQEIARNAGLASDEIARNAGPGNAYNYIAQGMNAGSTAPDAAKAQQYDNVDGSHLPGYNSYTGGPPPGLLNPGGGGGIPPVTPKPPGQYPDVPGQPPGPQTKPYTGPPLYNPADYYAPPPFQFGIPPSTDLGRGGTGTAGGIKPPRRPIYDAWPTLPGYVYHGPSIPPPDDPVRGLLG